MVTISSTGVRGCQRDLIATAQITAMVQSSQDAIIGDEMHRSAGGLALSEVGLSREMLEGNTIHEVLPPDVVADIEPMFRQALAGGESAMDVPYQGRIYLMRLGPLRAVDGTIVAGMGSPRTAQPLAGTSVNCTSPSCGSGWPSRTPRSPRP